MLYILSSHKGIIFHTAVIQSVGYKSRLSRGKASSATSQIWNLEQVHMCLSGLFCKMGIMTVPISEVVGGKS